MHRDETRFPHPGIVACIRRSWGMHVTNDDVIVTLQASCSALRTGVTTFHTSYFDCFRRHRAPALVRRRKHQNGDGHAPRRCPVGFRGSKHAPGGGASFSPVEFERRRPPPRGIHARASAVESSNDSSPVMKSAHDGARSFAETTHRQRAHRRPTAPPLARYRIPVSSPSRAIWM